MSSVDDTIRDYLFENVLTGYKPAVLFDESTAPFTDDTSKIVFTKMEGRPIIHFTRQHDCQVLLFSKTNANMADMKAIKVESEAALKALTESVKINACIANCDVIEDVTGPYRTNTNRYYYRFQIRTLTEF